MALLPPGSMLASRWIVGGVLGQSEGADVYEAEEASQRRFAALKLFAPAFASEPAWGEHAALTRALSDLPGDGIARAYDIGFDATLGRPFVASERVTFPTLSRYVAERGPVPLRALAQALATLGAALDAAHAAGVVHGGLKPQNVFVSYDNPRWARITDFSVGRLRASIGRGPSALLGWSAPEAAAGFMTPSADRYALALVCFFAATGIPWYNALRARSGPPSDRHTRIASERAQTQGGELDPLFDPWFAKALAADPDARFASGAELAQGFIDVFTGAPTAEIPARSFGLPHAETVPIRQSQVPLPHQGEAVHPLAETARAIAEDRGSLTDPWRASSIPPSVAAPGMNQGVPSGVTRPTGAPSIPPPSATALAPRSALPAWFWLGAGGIVLLALVALVWFLRS